MKRLVYSPKINSYIKADSGIYDVSEYITEFSINRKVNQVSSAELTLRNPYFKWTNHAYTDSITGERKVGPIFHPMDPITIILTRLQGRPVQVFTGYCDQTPYLQLYPGTVPLTASCTLKKLQYTYFDAGLPFMREFLEQNGWLPNEDGSIVKPKAEEEALNKETAKETNEGVRFGDSGIGGLLFNVLKDIGGWPEESIYIQDMPPSVITLISNLFELFKKEDEQASEELEELLKKIVGTATLSEQTEGSEAAGTKNLVAGQSATVMFDSADVNGIPKNANAVAGYIGGVNNFEEMKAKFPEAFHFSIAAGASYDAESLDIEAGLAIPSQAPAWVRRQIARGIKPTVYASASEMNTVIQELNSAGIQRSSYKVWTAHTGEGEHLCGPHSCGVLSNTTAEATQWNQEVPYNGSKYDQSVLEKGFLGGTGTAQEGVHR